MGTARGIAGSTGPAEDGCFLAADQGEADYGNGSYYLPAPVPVARLTLLRSDVFEPSPFR